MRNIAVILAAGTGTRVGGTTPKQFLPLKDGLSVLEYCVRTFEQCQAIDEIQIVTQPSFVSLVQQSIRSQGWRKVTDIVMGGQERWESSRNAILSITRSLPSTSCPTCNILIHDCARPFVSERILQDVCKALERHEAVTVAVPAIDTMYTVESDHVKSIPVRSSMMRAQTPQAFQLDLIRQAYERALQTGHVMATDDCGIVHHYVPEVPIYIVTGEEGNRKITFKEDLSIPTET